MFNLKNSFVLPVPPSKFEQGLEGALSPDVSIQVWFIKELEGPYIVFILVI